MYISEELAYGRARRDGGRNVRDDDDDWLYL